MPPYPDATVYADRHLTGFSGYKWPVGRAGASVCLSSQRDAIKRLGTRCDLLPWIAYALQATRRILCFPILAAGSGQRSTWAGAVPGCSVCRLHWLITQRFDSLAKIGKLNMPVLFIHGPADDIIPIFEIHDLFSILCNYDAELTPRLKFAQGKRECGYMKLFISRSNYHLTIGL